MTTRIPSRRLGQSALAALHPRPTRWTPCISLFPTPFRTISNPLTRKARDPKPDETDPDSKDLTNPVLEAYLRRREIEEGRTSAAEKPQQPLRPQLREGGLSTDPDSPFYAEREVPGWRPGLSPEEEEAVKIAAKTRDEAARAYEDKKLLAMNLDPFPRARRNVERQFVLRGVRRRGRLYKKEVLARTERQSVFKSQFLPTSVKKLQKVVNQIAGKTVSEALVQLRFSKKRVARDVIKGLEIAQNEAIAGRGMGLGSGLIAQRRWERQRAATDRGSARDLALGKEDQEKVKLEAREEKPKGPVVVELKNGDKKVVRDPTEIYIDQAWVGKGEMWKSPEYRARGMVNALKHRTTSFSVLLKEEKTRMRISEEIKKKRDKRKLWTALPDRPVTAQRQYCLW